jgi:hypothetical protein
MNYPVYADRLTITNKNKVTYLSDGVCSMHSDQTVEVNMGEAKRH